MFTRPHHFIITLFIFLVFNACAPKPYADTNSKYKKQAKVFAKTISSIPIDSVIADSLKLPPYWIGTVNFNLRKPNYVILHHTAQNSCEQTLKTFTLEEKQVSAHYLICKDGTLHHMLNDYLRAWHAGAGKWGNVTDVNSASVGVEIDNNGTEAFTEAQINTLLGLLATLKHSYNIPAANFVGHGDIAPGRKVDPSVVFPWKRLAEKGFGLWYADTANIVLPQNFDVVYALRIIGYDISNLNATIQAFRRHFLQTEQTGELTEGEKKVLFAVMGRFI